MKTYFVLIKILTWLQSETVGSSSCLSAASMARIAENFGERLTHLTLANNKFTALPQILSSVAVSDFIASVLIAHSTFMYNMHTRIAKLRTETTKCCDF